MTDRRSLNRFEKFPRHSTYVCGFDCPTHVSLSAQSFGCALPGAPDAGFASGVFDFPSRLPSPFTLPNNRSTPDFDGSL